jgi:hypothetical protein
MNQILLSHNNGFLFFLDVVIDCTHPPIILWSIYYKGKAS